MRGRPLLAVVAALAAATPAFADVRWQAPDECGTADDLTAKVAAKLGRALGADEVSVEIAIAADAGGYRASLQLDRAHRELTGATCGEVVDALALIVALAIREAPPPPPPPPIIAPAPIAPPPDRSPGASPAVELGVRAAVDGMILPSATVGAGPSLGVAARRWSAGAGLAIWSGRTANPGTLTATDLDLITGALELCARLGPAHACAAATAGPMTGRGFDDAGGASATRWWTAAGLAARWSQPIGGRVTVGGEAEALISLVRPRFVFDDGRHGYRAPAVTLRVGIVVTARILGGH